MTIILPIITSIAYQLQLNCNPFLMPQSKIQANTQPASTRRVRITGTIATILPLLSQFVRF